MEDISKARLENLKRYVTVSMAVILALLEGFYFFVMKVPFVQCVLEWLFGLSVCLVILHVSFRYIFRMQDRTTRQLNQMKMLYEMSKDLTSLMDLPQLLQAILDSAVAIISAASAGTIHLTDESRGRLMPRAASYHQFVAAEMGGMPLGRGVAGLAWKEKRTIHIADVSRDPRFIALDNAGTSFRSLLVAPLLMGEKCLGTISLHSNETNAFTTDDERLLSTLASQAAIAIENARLYEKVADRMREATALHRVSNTLMRTLNLEQLLENILEVLQRSLGYSHCAILLPEEETGELCIKAAHGYCKRRGKDQRSR